MHSLVMYSQRNLARSSKESMPQETFLTVFSPIVTALGPHINSTGFHWRKMTKWISWNLMWTQSNLFVCWQRHLFFVVLCWWLRRLRKLLSMHSQQGPSGITECARAIAVRANWHMLSNNSPKIGQSQQINTPLASQIREQITPEREGEGGEGRRREKHEQFIKMGSTLQTL